MFANAATAQPPNLLIDAWWPRPTNAQRARVASIARNATAIASVTALTAVCAQIVIPLPGTPVPFTMQTFAVLVGAAAIGPWRAMTSMILYLLVGALGAPVFSDGGSGVARIFSATGGYLIGFIAAAIVVGWLAQRGDSKKWFSAALAFLVGSLVIYLFGVTGLVLFAGMSPLEAISKGMLPFIAGDVIKAIAAGVVLPTAWRLTKKVNQRTNNDSAKK
jgi:biotin transport system substrate-specific component